MADEVGKVKISNLPLASSVSDNDAMLIVQNGSAKRVLPSLMKGKPGDQGNPGKTGQGFAYKWDGTTLILGTIAAGSIVTTWGTGVDLKGRPGDTGKTGAGSHVEQSGTKVRFGHSAVGQTSVTWGEYVQLRGSDAIYQWDGTSLKMGTRTYTVDGSTEEYSAGVDLKGATGQGMAYRWVGTKLQLGTIPVGGGEVSWITGIDLKGEQGLRGVHGTDLEYVWEGTSLKLGRITYREDGTETLTFSDPVNLQGNRGERGLQPAMQIGDVITLNPEETASATFVKDGTTTEGADIYKLNLSIPRGMAGKEGMPRIPSAVLSLKSESTSDEIFAAWGGKDAMLAVGTSFLAGEKSNCLMSGNATLYFAYTDADNFQLDILFRLEGKENQYDHRVVGGVATLTVTTYDNVHVNNASTMEKGKQYAFEPDTDGSASGVMKEVTVITQEEKDKINGTYTKGEIDSTFATKANTYTKDETYTKEEVEAKIPTLVDAYSKTESDERYPQKDSVYPKGDTYSKNEVDAKIPKVVDAYSKTESDERYPLKNNVYAKDKTYTKEEVDAKIPAPLDAYTKTESDEKFATKADLANMGNIAIGVNMNSKPTEDTLTYTVGEVTYDFKLGMSAIYPDTESDDGYGISFFKGITTEGKAIWGQVGGVGSPNETVMISLVSNQDESAVPDADLLGKSVHVIYGDQDKELVWQGEAMKTTVPSNTTYQVIFPADDRYKCPAQQEYFALAGTREVKGLYYTEAVTVNVTCDNSASTEGQQVTINGTVYDVDATGSVTAKIPFDVEYTVSVNTKSGYTSPSSVTETANNKTKIISVEYILITYGVFIEATDGMLYPSTDWTGAKTANSIVVKQTKVAFRIALTQPSDVTRICSTYTEALEKYMTAISDSAKAKLDMKSAENTANIMRMKSGTGYAAGYCNSFIFPDGKTTGLLPALGWLQTAYDNKASVDACLAACGAMAMDTSKYWASTFCGVSGNYRYNWTLNWSDGSVIGHILYEIAQVRPFAEYN